MSGITEGVASPEELAAAVGQWVRETTGESGAGVVVAVSGGMDSMVLLDILASDAELRPRLHVAHFDHQLRPGSGDDAAFVAGEAARRDLPWTTAAGNVRSRAAGARISLEMASRELRYEFLHRVMSEAGCEFIALGHHADDQAETVLFRIARGSGPRGLSGIRPRRSASLVRPLLPFRRTELQAYAAAHGVPSREDPSNRDTRWTRNRLRHDILPVLEAAVPGAAAALAALAETSRRESAALDALLDERIEALAGRPGSGSGFSFGRAALAALPDPVLTAMLRRVAARLGSRPGRAATADLLRFVRRSPSGKRVTLAGCVTVRHDRGFVRFRPPGAEG